MNVINISRYDNSAIGYGGLAFGTIPIPPTAAGNLIVVGVFNQISNGNITLTSVDGPLTRVPRIGFGNGDPDNFWLNGLVNSLDIYYQTTSGGVVGIDYTSDDTPSFWVFEVQPAAFSQVAATGSLPGGSTQAALVGPPIGAALAPTFTEDNPTDRFFTVAASFTGIFGEFDICLVTSAFLPVTGVSAPWTLDTIVPGVSLGYIAATSPPPPPPQSTCAPLTASGNPVNGVFIQDLSLFIIPATSLYKELVPFSAIKTDESHVQGRAEIILDFNDSEGVYSRDMGTIFTWPVFSETILDVWQPSIIPMDGEVYDRLSYHCLMTSLGTVGWQHAREMNIAYAAPAGLMLLLQFDQWPDIILSLPASVNEIKQKLTLPPNKFKLVEAFLSSPSPFKLWTNDLEMKIKQWGSAEPYRVTRPVAG